MAHTWKFFRAGGFDQVRLNSADDLLNLKHLDQKLWVSLACPTKGIEFEPRTLSLLDADGDGRIRAPELLAAIDWASERLLDKSVLGQSLPGVPLAAIKDDALRTLAQNLCETGISVLTPELAVAAEAAATAKVLADWEAAGADSPQVTEAAWLALDAVRGKLDDFFMRCRLAAFDARAAETLNPTVEALVADAAAIAALPLAKVGAGGTAPLQGACLNPAWSAPIDAFNREVVNPLLGQREVLSEADWTTINQHFAAHASWLAAKPAGLPAEAEGLRDLERLACYVRDLLPLANNFVAFRDFYMRDGKASFQIGTLFLDGRSAELCVAVNDAGKHGALATLSRMCLVYCDCVRGGDKQTIAAAFTAGDSDQLMAGRNGVFYDRQGRDWDATITKIIDHPISLRQAFWSPYKRLARLVAEQLQKVAASKAANVEGKLTDAAVGVGKKVDVPATAPKAPPTPFDVGKFAGIFAAIGLAVGAIGTAVASVLTGLLGLAWWQIPIALVGLMLLISGPAVVLAWFKLRSRNLGPLLDANGWAVNARARINIPFGTSLTQLAVLPENSERTLVDPFAEKERPWKAYVAVVLAIFVFLIVATH
jgi:hypothetical protein